MSDFLLRHATAADRDAILAVTLSAYIEYKEILPEVWEPYKQSILATLAHVSPAEQIVAERDGEILGTVLLYPSGVALEAPDGSMFTFEFPEVRLLAVTPAGRRQGVGTALMRECISRAATAGNTALTLHTMDIMQVAMQMYERMGFVRTPETDLPVTPELTVKGYRYSLV